MNPSFALISLIFAALLSLPAHARGETITITGTIDGSEVLKFTQGKIVWTHKHWGTPAKMTFDGVPWTDLKLTPKGWEKLRNLKFSKAKIISRSGRDIIALETGRDSFSLYLCDSPNGSDTYTVTIEIPKKSFFDW